MWVGGASDVAKAATLSNLAQCACRVDLDAALCADYGDKIT
jgi:hypothetical protein